MRPNLFRTYIISVVFIALISFPFINDRLGLVKDSANKENRRLSPRPQLDISYLDAFPVPFENYYNDTFALRSRIIHYFDIYNCLALKKSPFPDKLVIGEHNWLYLGGDDFDTYLGKHRLTDEELRILKNEFELRKKYLETKKCKFYVMITPGKAIVYPENIPATHYRINKQSWGEQLIDYLNKNSTVNTIDLLSYFKKIKSKDPLYYTTDNHWNHLGAFYAAKETVRIIAETIPGLSPLNLSDFKISKVAWKNGNMTQMLGDLNFFEDWDYEIVPLAGVKATDAAKQNYQVPGGFPYPGEYEFEKEIKGSKKPKLLIFSDSFGGHFFPFASESFGRTVKIFGGWTYTVDRDIVEKEKPDVVLLMIHESVIRNVFGNLNR